jgi:hypothetical protein
MRRMSVLLLLTVVVLLASCTSGSSDSTTTEVSESDPVGLSVDQLPPSVAAFKTAYESGDLETVKGIFADDGFITTMGNTYDLYYDGDFHRGTWDKDGSEFARLAQLHHGEMVVTEVIEVGDNTVAFDWAWEDFASGTAILYLRGEQIVVAVLAVTEDVF